MAVGTFFLAVGPGQFVARQVMVKFLLVELNDLKSQPVMVVMARSALLSLYQRRHMIAFLLVDAYFQFGMAGQTLGIRYLFA